MQYKSVRLNNGKKRKVRDFLRVLTKYRRMQFSCHKILSQPILSWTIRQTTPKLFHNSASRAFNYKLIKNNDSVYLKHKKILHYCKKSRAGGRSSRLSGFCLLTRLYRYRVYKTRIFVCSNSKY